MQFSFHIHESWEGSSVHISSQTNPYTISHLHTHTHTLSVDKDHWSLVALKHIRTWQKEATRKKSTNTTHMAYCTLKHLSCHTDLAHTVDSCSPSLPLVLNPLLKRRKLLPEGHAFIYLILFSFIYYSMFRWLLQFTPCNLFNLKHSYWIWYRSL